MKITIKTALAGILAFSILFSTAACQTVKEITTYTTSTLQSVLQSSSESQTTELHTKITTETPRITQSTLLTESVITTNAVSSSTDNTKPEIPEGPSNGNPYEEKQECVSYGETKIMYTLHDSKLYGECLEGTETQLVIEADCALAVVGESNDWYAVRHLEQERYIKKEYVVESVPNSYEAQKNKGGNFYKGSPYLVVIDYETDNSALAAELRNLLISQNYSVVMTYENGARPDEAALANIGNAHKANAFISLCNSEEGAFQCLYAQGQLDKENTESDSLKLSKMLLTAYSENTDTLKSTPIESAENGLLNAAEVPTAVILCMPSVDDEYLKKAAKGILLGIERFKKSLKAEQDRLAKEYVDKIAQKYNAMGVSVALINGGVVTDTYQSGWAVENSLLMGEDTKIRVASVSKVVLTMLMMQLYDEGKLDLDAPLADYMGCNVMNPSYPETTITLRHLFTHVSTLKSSSYVTTWDKMVSRLEGSSVYRIYMPGDPAGFMYNNYAFGLLGTIADSINGESLTSYARNTMFKTLKADGAYQAGNLTGKELAALYATTTHEITRSVKEQLSFKSSSVLGTDSKYYAGGLTISAYDLAKIISVLCNDGMYNGQRILSAKAVEEMEKLNFHFHNSAYDFDQALTLRHQYNMYEREEMYYHTGSAYGCHNCNNI